MERAEQSSLPGDAAFGAELYGQVSPGATGVFFSPWSLWVALSAMHSGARGETAAEMAGTLRLPALDPTRMSTSFGPEVTALRGGPGVDLVGATGLFGQKGWPFRSDFVTLLADRYAASLLEVDFSANVDQAREAIRAWVAERTRGTITDVIPSDGLDRFTRLVLLSAIHFKGSWASAFREKETRDHRFFHLQGGSSAVPLMYQRGPYNLLQADGAQLLELPYEGGVISMVAILPRTYDGLPDVEAKLRDRLGGWLDDLDRCGDPRNARIESADLAIALKGLDGTWSGPVDVYLPRFNIETKLRVKAPLQQMGMSRCFGPTADFSGIHDRVERLSIGDVPQCTRRGQRAGHDGGGSDRWGDEAKWATARARVSGGSPVRVPDSRQAQQVRAVPGPFCRSLTGLLLPSAAVMPRWRALVISATTC